MVPDWSKELNDEPQNSIAEKKHDQDLLDYFLLQENSLGTEINYCMHTKIWPVETTRNVSQARFIAGLTCGATIDIFDATDSRWRAYNIAKKRDQMLSV